MNLTPNQSLMLEAACEEVMAAGQLYRQRANQPLATDASKAAALGRYEAATDYLSKLINRLKEAHSND